MRIGAEYPFNRGKETIVEKYTNLIEEVRQVIGNPIPFAVQMALTFQQLSQHGVATSGGHVEQVFEQSFVDTAHLTIVHQVDASFGD